MPFRTTSQDAFTLTKIETGLFGILVTLQAVRTPPQTLGQTETAEFLQDALREHGDQIAQARGELSTDLLNGKIDETSIVMPDTPFVQDDVQRSKTSQLLARYQGRSFAELLDDVSSATGASAGRPGTVPLDDGGPGALCVVGGALAIAGALTGNPVAAGVGLIVVAAEC